MNSKNIKAILKLLAIILILTYFADKLIYWQVDKMCDEVYTGKSVGKLNHFLAVKDTMDVLVFGSSRANHHIDNKQIADKSFNMGLDGKRIAYSAALVKTLPENKKQTVIFHIDPVDFFAPGYKGADIMHLNSKYHKIKIIADEIDRIGQSSFLQKFYWSIDYNHKGIGILRNYLKAQYDYKLYDGYDPILLNDGQKKARDITLAKIDEKECYDSYPINELSVNYIKDIQEFCRKNNKKLFIVTSPKYQDPCQSTIARLVKFMEGQDTKYYNYINYFEGQDSNDYWKDKTHLSTVGADKFTQALAKEIKSKRISN